MVSSSSLVVSYSAVPVLLELYWSSAVSFVASASLVSFVVGTGILVSF